MYTSLLLSALSGTCLATPLLNSDGLTPRQAWLPAVGSLVSCDSTANRVLGPLNALQLSALVNNACAALMPPCAFQERLAPGTFCIQTITFGLDGPKSTVQDAIVQDKAGATVLGWAPKFAVYPPVSAPNLPPVQWTRQDCVGYFTTLLSAPAPLGCGALNDPGVGVMVIGPAADTPLAGTLVEVTLVLKPLS